MAEWKTIDELFDYEKGTLQSSKCTPGKYTFITAAEEWKTHETFTHDCEALIFAMAASGSLGRTHYVNGKFISSDLCFILTPKKGLRLDLTFYYRLFNFLRADIVKKTATGTSKLAINHTNFGAYRLPYFEYEHQLNFRSKIETITGINEKFSEGIDYQLLLLAKLRQAVLQEAIEGRLTAEWRKQNPEFTRGEHHASKLLEKIRAEKGLLIKEGEMRADKPVPPITDDEKPFILPEGWAWCRLGEIGSTNIGLTYSPNDISDSGIPVLRSNNIQNGTIDLNNLVRVKVEISRSLYIKKGDILICARNGSKALVGKAAQIKNLSESMAFGAFMAIFRSRYNGYIEIFLQSPIYRKLLDKVNTMTINQLTQSNLKNTIIPFPSFDEQEAIVERIDKLKAVISELEKQVTERKDQSEMLMQSVLQEAFTTNE